MQAVMKYIYASLVGFVVVVSVCSCASRKRFVKYKAKPVDIRMVQDQNDPVAAVSDEDIAAQLKELNNLKPAPYHVGASDKFSFSIYGEPDLFVKTVIVRTDGFITLPLIGDVEVQGLTMDEATKAIEARYKKYIRNPKAILIGYEFSSGKFTIMGKVALPGLYPIEKDLRVLDAIALSGGFSVGHFRNSTVELADLEHSYVVRAERVLPVDFVALIKKGRTEHNIPIAPGDYIYVPSSRNQEVYVIGAVKTPDAYGYRDSLTLTQVITYAQGTVVGARETEIRVIRGGLSSPMVYCVNFKKIKNGTLLDFRLAPGDIVFVPKTRLTRWNDVIEQVLPSVRVLDLLELTGDTKSSGSHAQ